MAGSVENPVYVVKVVDANGTTYNVTKNCSELSVSQPEKEIAKKVTFNLANIKLDGKKMANVFALRDKVYIYYNIGNGLEEMFRGIAWTLENTQEEDKTFRIVSYDNLIYLQNSKDSFYFPKGKTTKTILSTIAKKWGINIVFNYTSITHESLVFRNQYISDVIIDILEEVKKKTGKKYQIYSSKGTVYISEAGTNSTIYHIKQKENAMKSKVSVTMDGMVTQVLVTGDRGKNEELDKVLATVKGNTAKYGTLQAFVQKDKETSLSEAKKEANELLKEKGSPFYTRSLEAMDIPALKKGDLVNISTYNMSGSFIVQSIEHDCTTKTMSIEVMK